MRRADGWDVRLVRWADARRGAPFVWGETDCAILALEAIDAMAGAAELAPRFRGKWSNEREALRFQVRQNTDTAKELLGAGCEEVAPGFQQRGDIMIFPKDGFKCAGVCMGRMVLSVRPETPVCLVSLSDIAADGLSVLRLPG